MAMEYEREQLRAQVERDLHNQGVRNPRVIGSKYFHPHESAVAVEADDWLTASELNPGAVRYFRVLHPTRDASGAAEYVEIPPVQLP